MVLVLISGSAAVATLAGAVGEVETILQAIVMLVPTLIGAFSAIWNLSDRARKHELLANRFYQIASSIDVQAKNPDTVQELYKRILMTYANEPPTYHALNATCYNAANLARNREPEYLFPVKFHQHLFRNWIRFSDGKFKLEKQVYNAH